MSPTPGTPTARSTRSIIATSPVWLLGVLAAVAAAIVTELFALGARAIGVPMEAGSLGADTAAPIPLGGFAMGTLMWSVVGIILAVVLAQWAKRPARTFVVTTVVLTVLSLAGSNCQDLWIKIFMLRCRWVGRRVVRRACRPRSGPRPGRARPHFPASTAAQRSGPGS